MLFEDKYENHFLNIECGRARFVDFATFTLNAVKATGVPAALAALAPGLTTAITAFGTDVVTRTATSGTTQTNTATEDEQWKVIKAFITATDVKTVQPAYFENAKGLTKIYPNKLGGLTQAKKGVRLSLFEAYVQALEAATPVLTDVPGKAARALLVQYRAVAATKDSAESGVNALIKQLGPKAEAVCWALWDVHCNALAAYPRNPKQAAGFFNYTLLPAKKRGPKPSKV
jgi:hypothetical protein